MLCNAGYFRGKKVTVIGLARSGAACASLLHSLGAEVRVTEARDGGEISRFRAGLDQGIAVETGGHSDAFLLDRELIVVSPGVPFDSPPMQKARAAGIPVVSEIEIGWMLSPAPVIAVTGSNGKTTVTTLIARVIAAAGKKAVACGNIGNPFTGEMGAVASADFVSLEVSSFQLETIRDFKPAVAVILNFNRNHLDRHASMDEYLRAKKRIFLNQDGSDHLVLNADYPELEAAGRQARARVSYFRGSRDYNANQSAVLAVAGILGIPESTCGKVFSEFKGLEHRMETVAEVRGVRFVNDSKATTVESCVWALKNLPGRVVLICGGRDKGLDYAPVVGACRGKVSKALLIGEAADKIARAFSGKVPTADADTLEHAVSIAFRTARRGDTVLLSPMCASFDMFRDYEERGAVFKKAVFDLQKKIGEPGP